MCRCDRTETNHIEATTRSSRGGKFSFAHAKPFEDIPGADGLRGAASRGFVTIVGPCGDHHTLSKAAALALYRWLGRKLRDAGAMNQYAPVQKLVPQLASPGEWVSDALAKERAHG